MKIPDNIKIIGMDYKVELVDTLEQDDDKCMGTCDNVAQTIKINNTMGKDITCVTLLHEIIEALNSAMCINMKHDMINSLDAGLYQVLKENKLEFYDL